MRQRTAFIVAGMHRSGTSVTTRILHLLGADLGGELIPAGIGNERGHWESAAVQALHNALLAELDSTIYSPLNFAADWFDSAAARPWIARLRELIASEYADAGRLVVKDPRIALFLPLWKQALRELSIDARFVLPFRHPDAVADSLESRERRLGSGDALPHAQGLALWLRYVLAAEGHTRGEARAFVAFDAVLDDWRAQFARLGTQLGVTWPRWEHAQAEIDAFVERRVRDEAIAATPNTASALCRDVYASLQRAVAQPDAIFPAFDAAARTMAEADAVLGAHLRAREGVFGALRDRADATARRHEDERARMHERFAAEIGARDAQFEQATSHARSMEQALETLRGEHAAIGVYVQSLQREHAEASAYALSLQRAHADSAAYAQSLERDRDRAVDYARSLELSRDRLRDPRARQNASAPVFFTIVSRNYLAFALTLMQSVARQYPDALRYLILADRDEGDATLVSAPFATIPVEALALPDFEAFAFRYTIMEFNTAIKPYAFAELRRRHPRHGIVYLDPDILVLEPLSEVEAAFADGALAVLTPHLLAPIDDGLHPGERNMLLSGTYNCGFVAIGDHPQADGLIAWWADRLEFGAVSDVAAGLFTDQKWIDLVPGLFADVRVLRDEGYNLAYWNLSQRPVSRREGRWHAAGRPLIFVHFSGVDVDRPSSFSKHQNRHTQATIGALQPLYAEYLGRLAANGHAVHRATPYAFGSFADGEPICAPVRAVYRRYFDKGAAQAQAHPYTMDRDLYDLPCDEVPECADLPVTRVMYATWAMREDLRRVFDLGTGAGRDGFLRWFVSTAPREMGVPERHLGTARDALARCDSAPAPLPEARAAAPELLRRGGSGLLRLINWSCRFPLALRVYAKIPERARHRLRRRLERLASTRNAPAVVAARRDHPPGVNLVGYAHGEFGVAEILRRYAHTLEHGGVPFLVRNFDVGVASRASDRSMQPYLAARCRYDVNLFCINADQMPVARQYLGDAVFGGRYNIACWFWELEKFPEQWLGAIDLVDEIWVSSPFVRDAIAARTAKPVHIVPVALEVHVPDDASREAVGFDAGTFVFLYSFDFNSYVRRKNPRGAIAAFRRAFSGRRRDVRLVLKTINGERFPDALRELVEAAAGDDRIEVRDGFLDRAGMWALQACCDAYVSLHRSEGLGLGMAECMRLGKPVVATAYSGNLAFMNADNSCLVDYTLVAVEEGEYPAWQGQHWAEPDLAQAADYMTRLADDADFARDIGAKARASVSRSLSADASLEAITARLERIRALPPR